MPPEKYLEAGKLVGTHGVRGELRMNPLADSAEFLLRIEVFYIDGKPQHAVSKRVHKNTLLVTFPGIDTVEKAMALIGKTVFFDRADVSLPENTYFTCDLVGLAVFDTRTGRGIGTLEEVLALPANDVYVVRDGDTEVLIPVAPGFIEEVDIENGIMRVKTINGMLEDDD